ncbi:hypothetical protein Pla108_22230 [Botrimarina colliarenosi]|uniref:Uncharacterized protein n=1 Tax=Botrimarina colliarenosi TaxID=2528001 RepID=A0A5C6AFI4_9BACT|nr:hypothetical protein [Botrimarina colliarenosi]TWT98068.1 hypothetical protein Pla108_22230 [Botrimarina colliarenosi]
MAANSLESLRPERAASGLRVSAYDRTTSLLIALLLLVGMATFAIVIIYFSSRLERTPPAIPFTPVAPPGDNMAGDTGDTNDMMPGVENAPEVLERNLESLLDQLSIAATSDAVLMAEDMTAESADNAGASRGDPRGTGIAGNGTGGAREPRREIRFEPESVDQYAQWFDAVGLEIAVLGSDNQVYYASKLSTPKPTVRTGDPAADRRLYFNSSGGPLYPLDRKLAEKAGILDRGELVLQFCSPELQNKLLQLEKQAASGKATSGIALTVFKVVKNGSGFDFEVAVQRFY